MRDLSEILERFLIAKGQGDEKAWEAKLWAVKENSRGAGKVRDPNRLFVTDVGKCKRQVKYRTLGEKRFPPTAAKRLMFEQAEDIETTVAAAMEWDGLLIDYQKGVDLADRENWGGRKDVTIDDGTIEVKTSRSNAFRGDKGMPKPDHLMQAGIYQHYDSTPASLLYMDRGGENMPRQYPVPVLDWPAVSLLMDELDAVREDATLPDVLPPVLSRKNARKSRVDMGGWSIDWSGEIWLGPDWRCRYCDYDACPNARLDTTMLAKMTKTEPMKLTHDGRRHEGDVYEYLRSGQREMALA